MDKKQYGGKILTNIGGGKIVTKRVDLSAVAAVLDYLNSLMEANTEIILMSGNASFAKLVPYKDQPQPEPDRVPDLYPTMWVSDDFDDLLPGEYWLDDQS